MMFLKERRQRGKSVPFFQIVCPVELSPRSECISKRNVGKNSIAQRKYDLKLYKTCVRS